MERVCEEPAEDWYTRALQEFQAARVEEDRHWQLTEGQSAQPVLDEAYKDAVNRASQAKSEMREAARAVQHERVI